MVSDLTGLLDEVEGHAALAAGEEDPDMYVVVAFLDSYSAATRVAEAMDRLYCPEAWK